MAASIEKASHENAPDGRERRHLIVDMLEKADTPADHPLLGAPGLVCTPHVGFDTAESIDRRAEMAFENVTAFIAGNPVRVMK